MWTWPDFFFSSSSFYWEDQKKPYQVGKSTRSPESLQLSGEGCHGQQPRGRWAGRYCCLCSLHPRGQSPKPPRNSSLYQIFKNLIDAFSTGQTMPHVCWLTTFLDPKPHGPSPWAWVLTLQTCWKLSHLFYRHVKKDVKQKQVHTKEKPAYSCDPAEDKWIPVTSQNKGETRGFRHCHWLEIFSLWDRSKGWNRERLPNIW